jgi:hypothetical protein
LFLVKTIIVVFTKNVRRVRVPLNEGRRKKEEGIRKNEEPSQRIKFWIGICATFISNNRSLWLDIRDCGKQRRKLADSKLTPKPSI